MLVPHLSKCDRKEVYALKLVHRHDAPDLGVSEI